MLIDVASCMSAHGDVVLERRGYPNGQIVLPVPIAATKLPLGGKIWPMTSLADDVMLGLLSHMQHNSIQPLTNSCALRKLLYCALPANRRTGPVNRGVLLQTEGGLEIRFLASLMTFFL